MAHYPSTYLVVPPASFFPPRERVDAHVSIADVVDTVNSHKRQRGTGFAYLQSELCSLSHPVKIILQDLLHNHKIDLSDSMNATADTPDLLPRRNKMRKPIDTNMSDERILQLAQEGDLSFLASLLRILENEQGSVTTKFFIKAGCLAVEPGKVPAYCDAKEMVMTALYFMSQSYQPGGDSDYFPTLPLMQAVSNTVDMEKRAYIKVGNWKLVDILPQILRLEQVFYESCSCYKWVAREHAAPKLTNGRNLLLLKGSPPATCIAKARKTTSATAPRKRSNTKVSAAGVSVTTNAAAGESVQADATVEASAERDIVPIDDALVQHTAAADEGAFSEAAAHEMAAAVSSGEAMELTQVSNNASMDDDAETDTFLPCRN
ncbi:hypothetical protein MPSEU_000921200 [Mayamaea pseudoterrestris]|nr:hypothetical protein MPSEU_000921200 [Mayamaea pseudoterrestris]